MKTVVITGANRGIGYELTRHYLEQGHAVFATCRNPSEATQLQALQTEFCQQLVIVSLDVTDHEQIKNFAAHMAGRPVDLLINNAGVYGPKSERGQAMEEFYGPALADLTAGDWLPVLHVNTIAPMLLTAALLPSLRLSPVPVIAMISTMMGSIGSKDYGGCYIYSSSKAALNMVGKSLANDLRPEGKFSVLMLHPGWVSSDMGGPNAEIAPVESARGMATVLAEKGTPEHSGEFYNYDGTTREW